MKKYIITGTMLVLLASVTATTLSSFLNEDKTKIEKDALKENYDNKIQELKEENEALKQIICQ